MARHRYGRTLWFRFCQQHSLQQCDSWYRSPQGLGRPIPRQRHLLPRPWWSPYHPHAEHLQAPDQFPDARRLSVHLRRSVPFCLIRPLPPLVLWCFLQQRWRLKPVRLIGLQCRQTEHPVPICQWRPWPFQWRSGFAEAIAAGLSVRPRLGWNSQQHFRQVFRLEYHHAQPLAQGPWQDLQHRFVFRRCRHCLWF